MARVERIEKGDLESGAHPTSVVCAAQLVPDGQGSFLVQLASFGSKAAESNGRRHVTQTYQFDRNAAATLVSYFTDAFGEDFLTEPHGDA
ncbi:hypothetical protein GCM10023065_21730 [Microbacterium laevaniformans]|uniref:hypothetical protein n=1 Tax=Microbacterium laevaniformans TaxID=36807 RepID=UPI0003A6C3EC|nr:hypothetical protein [Microbacterium laevaniformans]GLJ64429.1 hypothetical protein GCM10017578_13170 [Microbacterium laevaniformans]